MSGFGIQTYVGTARTDGRGNIPDHAQNLVSAPTTRSSSDNFEGMLVATIYQAEDKR